MDWSSLQVVGADLPPRSDAPGRLVPIVRNDTGQIYRVRPTHHGDVLEPLDEATYVTDCEVGDALPIFPPQPAREGYWLIKLGEAGLKYCPSTEAAEEFDAFARRALDRAEECVLANELARAFAHLDNAVLARPGDPLSRAALIAAAHKLQRDDAWLYEQWLESAEGLDPAWATRARKTHRALRALIIADDEIARRLNVRPRWLPPTNSESPSSHFGSP